MTAAILFVELVVAGILFTALGFAVGDCCKRKWLRGVCEGIGIVLPSILFVSFVALAVMLRLMRVLGAPLALSIALLVLWGIGAATIVRRFRRHANLSTKLPPRVTSPLPLACALVGMLALLAGTLHLHNNSVRRRLDEACRDAVAMAATCTPPPLEADRNAAIPLRAIGERVRELDLYGGKNSPSPPSIHDALGAIINATTNFNFTQPEISAFLAEHASLLAEIRAAVARPGMSLSSAYNRPTSDLGRPEIDYLRCSGHLLTIDAWNKARRGESSAAIDDLTALERLAEHLAAEPLYGSLLIGVSLDKDASRVLEAEFPTLVGEAGALEQTLSTDPNFFARRFWESLRLNEASNVSMFADRDSPSLFEAINISSKENEVGELAFEAAYRLFLKELDIRDFRSLLQRSQSLAADSYWRVRDDWEALRRDWQQEPHGIFARLMTPTGWFDSEYVVIGDTRRRLARAAVHAWTRKKSSGAWPTNITEIGIDEWVIDPFSGQALCIKVDGEAVRIYSLGPNGVDDGGVQDENPNEGDIVFTISPPKATPP